MRKSLTFLVLLAGFFQPVFTQNTDWRSKITPTLRTAILNPDTTVEFLIIMQQQADLSPARQMHKKTEKGRFVYQTLSALAEKEQHSVRDLLQQKNAPMRPFWIINGLWAKGSAGLIEQIAKLPEVGRLEPDPVWHLSRPPQESENMPVQDRSLPWGLTKINADDVWNLGYDGDGIVVGGEDTGYEWEHPAIKSRYRGWNGSTVDHDYNWHDAIHALIGGGSNSCGINLSAPCDDHGHGTHTMGTMTGNDGTDNIGVAPGATWIGCRNMEEGDGKPDTYIECFEWFVAPTDHNDENDDPDQAPHVINNSWGCPTSEGCDNSNYATMETVVNNVRAAGILVVVSAGNSGSGCHTVDSPAAIYDASFTVGATDENDNIAWFSSRGPVTVYTNIMKPDISAPGMNVRSSVGTDNNSGSYHYESWNGTSMAGPHVAGTAALIMDAKPNLIGNVDELEDLMRNSAVIRFASAPFCGTDNGSSHPNNVYGWGRLDALAAVNAALPIELLEFTARSSGKTALLHWVTGSEKDCSHFSIQRSGNGISWKNIGELPCLGNGGAQETTYDFSDPEPLRGLNYYRLEQMDFSGETTLSPARALSFAAGGYNLKLISGKGKAYFEVIGEKAEKESWLLEVRTTDGRVLQRLASGAKGWITLAEGTPAGIYIVTLQDSEGRSLSVEKWLWIE